MIKDRDEQKTLKFIEGLLFKPRIFLRTCKCLVSQFCHPLPLRTKVKFYAAGYTLTSCLFLLVSNFTTPSILAKRV